LSLNLYFGLHFDSGTQPHPQMQTGHVYLGSRQLLRWFETQLGLDGHPERVEHIRVEQYRQALSRYQKGNPSVFYAKSFFADQLATAENLLARRDELLAAGWGMDKMHTLYSDANAPIRLKVLADIEAKYLTDELGKTKLVADQTERFEAVLQALATKNALPIDTFWVNEPIQFLPPPYKRLFDVLRSKNIAVKQLEITKLDAPKSDLFSESEAASDLNIFKDFVENKLERGNKQKLKADGSLIILESTNDIEAAAFVSKILSKNQDFIPTFIIPDSSRTLDDALIHNGLPSFGLLSTSNGRPTLQLLKLVTTFLWRPLDPHKILEFVTMPSKPLDDELASIIANAIAQRPGVGSDLWLATINGYFDKLNEKAVADPTINVGKIKHQFKFWFDRQTYDIAKSAPKDEITSVFRFLKDWANDAFDASSKTQRPNTSLVVLKEQARRIEEYLDELPKSESFLTFLELERIIRTIYEPTPVQPRLAEKGHYPFVAHGDCLLAETESLVWWNWSQAEAVNFFSRWYTVETDFLKKQGVVLQTPQDENALMLWSRIQPIVRASKRLCLVFPKKSNGQSVMEHPLFSHLHACFGDLESILVKTDVYTEGSLFIEKFFKTPQNVSLKFHKLGKVSPQIDVHSKLLTSREYETLTSLESLFYYPHQWVFRHKARLSKSPILSIVKENTLKGNLAHRFFELVLKEDFSAWGRPDVEKWVDDKQKRLMRLEAAPLLMYGYEPERAQFVRQVKNAIWSLIEQIQINNWTVKATEMDLNGKFSETPVKGKADVVLARNNELCVLDLKWGGRNYREQLIKNGEDLQLVMYSRLLTEDEDWAHTAYFIIEKAHLLARNTHAFKDLKPLAAEDDAFQINQNIYQKMIKTYEWRLAQVQNGKVEIRTATTEKQLEDLYGMELLDVLEMKKTEARFDDYRTLIGLVK
jgi:ATP-dependent helicase/nuclease subunit B